MLTFFICYLIFSVAWTSGLFIHEHYSSHANGDYGIAIGIFAMMPWFWLLPVIMPIWYIYLAFHKEPE